MSVPTSAIASIQHATSDLKRPYANFPPGIWGDFFLKYASSESTEDNVSVKHQIRILKEDVKKMLQSPNNHQNIAQKLNLIDAVQRLGVCYHFKGEIDEELEQIRNSFTEDNDIKEEGDLQSLALIFRLLRQQGYHISQDIFNKFKNNKGTFEEKLLANDVQGLLKLYEAAQLRVHGEDILDEAHDFAYSHLEFLSNTLSHSLAAQIKHYLKLPFHKREPRSETKYYMTVYEEDPLHNESLLTFAKLDFNIRQKMHQKEMSNINRWYKKLDSVTKVPYARDRVVAGYFWGLAMSDEPEYSIARKMTCKMLVVCSLLDDTFDAYGTLEELELFTEAFRRWDKSPCESLPECMKVVFDGFVQVCNEMEMLMAEEGKPNMIQYFKQAVYDVAESYLVEAKWCQKGYTPKYDEYKNNGVISSVYPLIMVTFISMGKFASKKVLDWISSKPNIIIAASLMGRLLNDMGSYKFEQQREHVASAVECCMNQYGISLEDAYKVTCADVTKYWKDINEECLKLITDIPKHVLDCVIKLARITEFMYEDNGDKYTNEELLKDHVFLLLVEPISIKK